MIPAMYNWLRANSGIANWYQYGLTGISRTTPKPFGIIEMGPLLRSVNNRAAGVQVIRLTLVYPRQSWVAVEQACETIRRRMDGLLLTRSTGEKFRLDWADASDGGIDTDLDAFVKTLTFQVFTAL